jgi:hypothetical protein
MPCPKNGVKLHVISLKVGILSAFCHFCSEWHNWTHLQIEELKAARRSQKAKVV